MQTGHYRYDTPLQRSRGPMPRWVRLTLIWTSVAFVAMFLSRAITVAGIHDVGPPPSILAIGEPTP